MMSCNKKECTTCVEHSLFLLKFINDYDKALNILKAIDRTGSGKVSWVINAIFIKCYC